MTLQASGRPSLDRRLLALALGSRRYLLATVTLGVVSAGLVVVQAVLIASVIAAVFHGSGIEEVSSRLLALPAVMGVRGGLAWLTELAAHRSAAAVKSGLRLDLLAEAVDRRGYPPIRAAALAAAAGPGVEALDVYFARYLPQMVIAVAAPILVLSWVFRIDFWSGLIVLLTLPLVPLFAALIGSATRARVQRRRQTFVALTHGFVESVRALPTWKIFGRSREQISEFAQLADRHRTETMSTLRVAFLSAFALELVATISVAVVAVAVGIRVLNADLDLQPALTVLVLAPEAYLPLRRLAAEFHAAADGMESAAAILDETSDGHLPQTPGSQPPPPGQAIHLREVGLQYPDREEAALDGLSLTIRPGEYIALVGASGAGKSTTLALLLGLIDPDSGTVVVGETDLRSVVPESWHQRIGWLPQSPHLFSDSVANNVRFGLPEADEAQVWRALDQAAAGFVRDLADGIHTRVGTDGAALSAGERRRIALARALIREPSLLLLDEPTAHLDPLTEAEVLDTLDECHRAGTTIVIASHRESAAARADRVIRLAGPTRVDGGSGP